MFGEPEVIGIVGDKLGEFFHQTAAHLSGGIVGESNDYHAIRRDILIFIGKLTGKAFDENGSFAASCGSGNENLPVTYLDSLFLFRSTIQ